MPAKRSPQDGQLCDECHLNYDLVHGACVGKIPGCLVASPIYEGSCEFCNTNWELFHGRCFCKIRNCNKCHENGKMCIQCANGFVLQADNTECACTLTNCAECDPEDGTKCLACKTSYTLDSSGRCTTSTCSIDNCKTVAKAMYVPNAMTTMSFQQIARPALVCC